MRPALSATEIAAAREKNIRFENLSEIFTFIAVVGGAILSLLPYEFNFDKRSLQVSLVPITLFTVFWFRILPRKYSGETKNFLWSVLTIPFVAVAVHFTRGVQSPAIFLYYITSIGVAATMGVRQAALLPLFASVFIVLESFYGYFDPSLKFQAISLGLLHLWGLSLTSLYGWLVFQEENSARVREQKAKLQKIEAVDQVKNEFVYIISKKLKEPIASLKESLATVSSSKKSLSKEENELLDKTVENSTRLASLVDDLSDLSKIESGRLSLEMKKVDIGQIIAATMSDFTFPAHEKNIKLVYDPPKDPIFVLGDPGRLHEVIANLVDNAIKYSQESKEIKVDLNNGQETTEIRVKDQGFGIPTEAKNHLFEKFYRVDRPDRVEPKGTGLGLFITKQLIERHGGRIWYESEVDKGTTFIFTLLNFKDSDEKR